MALLGHGAHERFQSAAGPLRHRSSPGDHPGRARLRGASRAWSRRSSCTPASTTTRRCPRARSSRRGLPRPDHNLGVGSLPPAEQVGLAQRRLAELIERERPDAVLVRGDTNATLSGARAASQARRAAHARRGRPALSAHGHARGVQPDRDRPAVRSAAARRPRARGRNLLSEGLRGEIHVTGDPLCDMLESLARRDHARRAASTCWRRCTATTTPTTPSACARCWSA